jgi:hypothetical protein
VRFEVGTAVRVYTVRLYRRTRFLPEFRRNILSACIKKKAGYSPEAPLNTHSNCVLFSPCIVNDYNRLVQTNAHITLISISSYLACEFPEDGDQPEHVGAS